MDTWKIILGLFLSMADVGGRAWAVSDAERADAFLVTMNDQNVKVVSPHHVADETSVIIDNTTLSKIYARLDMDEEIGDAEEGSGAVYVAIPPQSIRSINIKMKGKKSVPVLYPMAPAFQEIPLIAGKKSYEIPSKE